MQLSELVPGARVRGLVPGRVARLEVVKAQGDSVVRVIYETADGDTASILITAEDAANLTIETGGQGWPFDGDGEHFLLASEARRIKLGHLRDPFIAVGTSDIDPLPHQIEAVYQEMLPRQPLRFLLADDPGAGKTIMSGLLVKELRVRGDADRVLIVAPGSLVEQWQDELDQRFDLKFDILSRDMIEAARTGNPFIERNLLIARLDQLSRNEVLRQKLQISEWDLVVVDEAHKLAAHLFGGEVRKTGRFELGELLRGLTRHFLLLTATPHSGKEADFQLFMSLLDPDRFAVTPRAGSVKIDPSDLMRRYVKEHLLTFDGRRLFPERRSQSVKYELSPAETYLYEEVTDYVRNGMGKARELMQGGDRKRGLMVGFALAALQRRLASSPQAICRSLKRRRIRLEDDLARLRSHSVKALPLPDLPKGVRLEDLEDFDPDDYDDTEVEEIEDVVLDAATSAQTVEDIEAEIKLLQELETTAMALLASLSDTKWNELKRILQSDIMIRPDGIKRKLIVFTEHRDTLDYLVERVGDTLGPNRLVAIHGGIRREDRRRVQERFTTDPDVQILVATDAAGEGVNLQRANLMVNYDLPWNPNRIEQRFGRIHRIGQKDVCHLWNLVAHETREGAVFVRLFEKLEQQRETLGSDQVYDVLGEEIISRSLRELLLEAIEYGDRPDVRARLDEIVDGDVAREAKRLVEASSATQSMGEGQIEEIRLAMERAKAQRLQPGFIRHFFIAAFEHLGGRVVERQRDRFEITRVPAVLRSPGREAAAGGSIHSVYERVVFETELVRQPDLPIAQLIALGHPLLNAVIDVILERYGDVLDRGTVLVDPDDPGTEPRLFMAIDHVIENTVSGKVVSHETATVCLSGNDDIEVAADDIFLTARPATPEEQIAAKSIVDRFRGEDLVDRATDHAIEHIATGHFARVVALTGHRVDRIRVMVAERLGAEIRHWDAKVAELKSKELGGKKRGGMSSGRARQLSQQMEDRLENRLAELDAERVLANRPPTVRGGAVVVPAGLLELSITGPSIHAVDVGEVDRRAVAAVLAAEKALGRVPTEMEHANPGYDIESFDPESGELFFIEVKGRIERADTVTVKSTQIIKALNNPESFVLALAKVPEDRAAEPIVRYLRRPFEGINPRFGVVSETFSLPKIWRRGKEPW